jgi:sec-independent protein translocase protein TatA
MFGLGFGELVVILLIVVLIFGAGKLPQLGDALGRSIRNFKKSATGDDAQARTDESKDDAKRG